MKFLSLLFVASSSVSATPYRFGKIDGSNFKKYDLKDKQFIDAVSFSKMSSNLEKWGMKNE